MVAAFVGSPFLSSLFHYHWRDFCREFIFTSRFFIFTGTTRSIIAALVWKCFHAIRTLLDFPPKMNGNVMFGKSNLTSCAWRVDLVAPSIKSNRFFCIMYYWQRSSSANNKERWSYQQPRACFSVSPMPAWCEHYTGQDTSVWAIMDMHRVQHLSMDK